MWAGGGRDVRDGQEGGGALDRGHHLGGGEQGHHHPHVKQISLVKVYSFLNTHCYVFYNVSILITG